MDNKKIIERRSIIDAIRIMLAIADYADSEAENGNYEVIKIGVGARAISSYLRKGASSMINAINSLENIKEGYHNSCAKMSETLLFLDKMIGDYDIDTVEDVLKKSDYEKIRKIIEKRVAEDGDEENDGN